MLVISFTVFIDVVEQKQDFKEKDWGKITSAVVSEIIDTDNGEKQEATFNNLLPYMLLIAGVVTLIIGLRIDWK